MRQLIIETTDEQTELISEFLTDNGALAVSLQDAGDQPLFQEKLQETPLWKNTCVQGLFDENVNLPALIVQLEALLAQQLPYQIVDVDNIDWVAKTQQNFPAQCFAERLWIIPECNPTVLPVGTTALRLSPGLGFGTGSHPTTKLCLTWLAQQNLNNQMVVDYGCGSGILGLSALAMGAKYVWAVDHDVQALTATRDNAALNHFALTVLQTVLPEELPMTVRADIVLANILANPLCELAPRLIALLAPNGKLVLSGFLTPETERVLSAYQPILQVTALEYEEEWGCAVLAR